MAYSVSHQVGVDLVNTVLATDIASGARTVPFNLGQEVFGSDGKLYVFAKAGGAISASTAVCTIGAAPTFSASATGGAYTSPATAMATGDYGWFSKASV